MVAVHGQQAIGVSPGPHGQGPVTKEQAASHRGFQGSLPPGRYRYGTGSRFAVAPPPSSGSP